VRAPAVAREAAKEVAEREVAEREAEATEAVAAVVVCWERRGRGETAEAVRWVRGREKKALEAPWERRGTRRTAALALGRERRCRTNSIVSG